MYDSYLFNNSITQRVQFNPENPEHRKIVATYLKTQSWKHTKIRFMIERPYTDVVTCVTSKLARYYAEKEFKNKLD